MSQLPTTPPQKLAAEIFLSANPTGSLNDPISNRSSTSSAGSQNDGVFDSPTPKGRSHGVEYRSAESVPSTPGSVASSGKAFQNCHDQEEKEPEEHDKTEIAGESSGNEPENKRLLAQNPFDNEQSKILFEAIDQLQSWGSSKYLKIPQLVIVGMQSSGKSSLLKTLTQIPFPVKAGCCTRFPTRIVSRHTPPGTPNHFRITIEDPGVQVEELLPADDKNYLREGETLTDEVFEEVINEVRNDYMGIRDGQGHNKKNFVANVLRVELSGSNCSHFSILDLPGTFASDYDVNENEMEGVQNMVVQYMKKEENIVICVADGSADLSNQGFFTLALKHVDPERRIGVFTKCDIPGADETVSKAINGQAGSDEGMPSGWFVVQNRVKESLKPSDLISEEERRFSAYPWSGIFPSARRGSTALRTHLGEKLSAKIREAFPAIKTMIASQLSERLGERSKLGKPRKSHSDRQQYLVGFVHEFNSKAKQALTQPGILGNEPMELRGAIRHLNDEYDAFMREKGHSWEFRDEGVNPSTKLAEGLGMQAPFDAAKPAEASSGKTSNAFQGFEGPGTSEELYEEIREQLSILSASQLPGVINPSIYPTIYRKQVRNWTPIAEFHLETTAEAVKLCVEDMLDSICPSKGATSVLRQELGELANQMFEKTFEEAKKKMKSYCRSETQCELLQTSDPRFGELVLQWRRLRHFNSSCAFRNQQGETNCGPLDAFNLSFNLLHLTMNENMSDDVHDVLKVYYQLALNSFIRHITSTLVEDFVSHEDGPLMGLNMKYILALREEEVARLAREDDATVERRKELEQEIIKLQGASAIAERATNRTRGLSVA